MLAAAVVVELLVLTMDHKQMPDLVVLVVGEMLGLLHQLLPHKMVSQPLAAAAVVVEKTLVVALEVRVVLVS
jgi:hypothetical protein